MTVVKYYPIAEINLNLISAKAERHKAEKCDITAVNTRISKVDQHKSLTISEQNKLQWFSLKSIVYIMLFPY